MINEKGKLREKDNIYIIYWTSACLFFSSFWTFSVLSDYHHITPPHTHTHTFNSRRGLCCHGRAENVICSAYIHIYIHVYAYIYIYMHRDTSKHVKARGELITMHLSMSRRFRRSSMRSHLSEESSIQVFFLKERKKKKKKKRSKKVLLNLHERIFLRTGTYTYIHDAYLKRYIPFFIYHHHVNFSSHFHWR